MGQQPPLSDGGVTMVSAFFHLQNTRTQFVHTPAHTQLSKTAAARQEYHVFI